MAERIAHPGEAAVNAGFIEQGQHAGSKEQDPAYAEKLLSIGCVGRVLLWTRLSVVKSKPGD
jgi:hypothetical protein